MNNESHVKKPINKISLIIRSIFIVVYIIILYFLYLFLINLGVQHLIVILILVFLILIVIGPLITGISKAMFHRLFSQKKDKKEKSDYEIYKEELKSSRQTFQTPPVDTKDISLEFKYRKPVIRKCNNCKIIVPNFVKKCPNCGKPIID